MNLSSQRVIGIGFNKEQLDFMQRLCDSFGPSGFEREAAKLTKEYVSKFTNDVSTDKLGSVLFKRKGTKDTPVILVNGHVDEVGFLISSITNQGFLTFNQLGGWFDQVLLSQRVRVRTQKGDIFGVIASKPPPMISQEERNRVMTKDRMFIDVGASNKKEAEKMGVRIGDGVVPDSKLSYMEKTVIKDKKEKGKALLAIGKAFDDRIGVFVATEVLRELTSKKVKHPNMYVGAATTMEEVGIRGARTAAYLTNPNVNITVEVALAGDTPGIENPDAHSNLGDGPTLYTHDATMIPNQPLKELVIEMAKKKKIPLQLSTTSGGGTDAGMIHMMRAGCPSVVIGVPTRYIHSHVGILNMKDAENCIRLVVELIKVLDEKTVKGLTEL
jgi:endoglucanase